MIDGLRNALLPDELCLKYSGYWRTWSRVLFVDYAKGEWVEVNLTPINPTVRRSWPEQVFGLVIRHHRTGYDPRQGDRLFRHVVKNRHSVVYQELKGLMLPNVPIEIVHRLLNEDFLSEIDWNRYTEANHGGGGVPFALCKTKTGGIPSLLAA